GVDNGARLRIPGEGESGANNGPPGDLYVVISVREHPFFRRQNENIYCEIPISFPQAALGADLKVPTLYGEEKLKIPEGTQPGTVFRLKGKGVESLNGRGKGDQLIAVSVVTPTKLSRQEMELYEKLDEISDSPMEKVSGEGFFTRVKDIFG
ncbi:MAG TPA: DnaJ C-terminal domain-containing protein, partial [Acidobacteriota bacterium]|nr:DnaJ C-terminal domain-containing protein [Acidobacteriota bacterium]